MTERRSSATIEHVIAPPAPQSQIVSSPLIDNKESDAKSEPLHPRFASLKDRLQSFDDDQWPSKCPIKPEDLAAAGFYYYGSFEGIRDSVKCFHCDAGLCLWEKGDDPWTEHRRVSPNCHYVLQFHPEAIRQKEQAAEWLRKESARNANDVVDDWMTGLMVVRFLEKNRVSRTLVRNALHRRWLQTKMPFESVHHLQEAVDTEHFRITTKFGRKRLLRYTDWYDNNRNGSDSCGEEESGSSEESDCGSSQSSSLSSQQSSQSSDQENSSSGGRMLCKVCLDNVLEVVFIPCGHFVSCGTCSQNLSRCPYCRTRITSAIKTYLN